MQVFGRGATSPRPDRIHTYFTPSSLLLSAYFWLWRSRRQPPTSNQKTNEMEKKFGLIGATVSHSYSKSYFDEKFFQDGLRDYHYDLYPLKNIDELKQLLKENPEICGLNVTIPYKEQVMK